MSFRRSFRTGSSSSTGSAFTIHSPTGALGTRSIHPSGVPLPITTIPSGGNNNENVSNMIQTPRTSLSRTIAGKFSNVSPGRATNRKRHDHANDISNLVSDVKSQMKIAPDVPREGQSIDPYSAAPKKRSRKSSKGTSFRRSTTKSVVDASAGTESVSEKRSGAADSLPSSIKTSLLASKPRSPELSGSLVCDPLNSSRVSFGSPGAASHGSPNRSVLMKEKPFSLEGPWNPDEDNDDIQRRREHDRTVQHLVEQLYRDLEQERLTVKDLLKQERMHQERLKEMQAELDRQRETGKNLIDRLFQSKLEVDQKERMLQTALADAMNWKQVAKGATDREHALEMRMMTVGEQSATTTKSRASLLRRFFNSKQRAKANEQRSNQLWLKMEQELTGLRQENALLTKTLMEFQRKENSEKSAESLLSLHQAMVAQLGTVTITQGDQLMLTNQQELVAELETSLLSSFERS